MGQSVSACRASHNYAEVHRPPPPRSLPALGSLHPQLRLWPLHWSLRCHQPNGCEGALGEKGDTKRCGRGTGLITETSPGKWTYVQTDVDGKTEVWTGEFTEDSMVWRSPKDQVEITYSRYGDPTGTWKAVYLDSTEMLRFYGMDDALIQKIESESHTMDVQHVGKGVWEWESHS